MKKRKLLLIFLLPIFYFLPLALGSSDKAHASVTKELETEIQSILKEGESKGPKIFLSNAEKVIEDALWKLEMEKRSYKPYGGTYINLFTIEQIEANRKAAQEEERILRVTTRNRAKEILEIIITELKSILCPDNKPFVGTSSIINASLVVSNDVIMTNASLANLGWEVSKAIVRYLVPYILDIGKDKFCRG